MNSRIVHRSTYVWKATKAIRVIGVHTGICPHCSSKLYSDETVIPVDKDHAVVVSGEKCRRCDCLYVADKREAEHLLKDNKNAREYTLDGNPLWNYTSNRKEEMYKEQCSKLRNQKRARLRNISTGAVLITVQFTDAIKDYIIVHKAKERNERSNILHYSEFFARELLTTAFRESRDRRGEYNSEKYHVADIIYPQSNSKGSPSILLPTELYIKSGGGLLENRSSKDGDYGEVLHVLLYSPFTERYELIKATHDRFGGYFYTDQMFYREFVEKWGKPDLKVGFGNKYNFDVNYSDLQIESALKQYGYSVSQKDCLSEQYRHELLAELVDLELLDVMKIVKLLSFFISSHASPMYNFARSKWEADKAFISAYRVNPERFIIKP